MDLKRKSVFSSPTGAYSKGSRMKVHHLPSNHSALDTEDRFNMVSDVLNDALKNLRCNQNRGVGVDLDILNAASELNRALRRAKGHTSTASTSNSTFSIDHSAGTVGTRKHLPALPPIMDEILERAVFTHPGVSSNIGATYDRLEILGDAYIELIATKLIWERFQEIPSGRISQIRELLVKNETLAGYATSYGLDSRAIVPQDYPKQPKRWTKTRGDIFEAYVAAIIISNPVDGYRVAEQWLTQLWHPRLTELGSQESTLNAKEMLARKIMGKGIKLRYIDEQPPVKQGRGMQTFFIGVYLTGWGWDNKHLGSGQGPNKTIAGNEAARQALQDEALVEEISHIKREHEAERD
ncbi:ribonuclease III domain-containing protein [Aspergillus leporis]|uniref:Ribonuclease III domain-containing protein n=1 Tax=Aspergillus leporis TaxID=41062 RepID=A0A5N5WWW7_9EURO|nr:ribonuclease III domain-containing protein [Aspergillus leporis]